MKSALKNSIIFWIFIIVLLFSISEKAFASHAQGTDITYQCLGGNQYRVNLSFYRDCAGVAAPNTASVNISSVSCGQSFNITLNRVPGTGIDVTPICPQLTTQCNGGTYPGVQEWLYTAVVTLPAQCTDWVFGFTLCCRNAAITTIANPSSQNIYVESTLNNLTFNCNNSPSFLNKPIPFVCVGQPYCFNNGANEVDGDSLYYRLVTPKTSPTATVTYNTTYSATQPLASSPAVVFNSSRGDICMYPTMIEVTVFAMIVEEWRNGIKIGSVMRDIQMKTTPCTNTNPYVNGINNTGNYTITACAGTAINLNIPTFDPDANQNVTITWDNGIPAGTFTSTGGSRPTGTFSWTPTAADISTNPYCFTVTVKDDNCTYFGSQVFSFCITVEGFSATTSSTNANCGASNGTASVQVTPAGNYSYLWSPNGGNNSTANGLQAGTYSVTVTSAGGCSSTSTVTVGSNGGPLNVNLTPTNVLCYGASTGSIVANANGGQQPYTYSWSNGPTTPNNTGLGAGTYTVVVTTNNGCSATVAGVITQPSSALSYTIAQSNVTCSGLTNGSATITTSGGTTPYSYSWNTTPVQTTSSATNLSAGNYSVIITDGNGCSTTGNVTIIQPNQLIATSTISNNVTCNGAANGTATTTVSGGTTPYTYSWNTTPVQTTPTATGLASGNYTVIVSDANNCSSSSTVTITQPTAVALNVSGININCFGAANGQTSVVATGGTPNYTYQWSPSGGTGANATGLSAGTYTVYVSDNNSCTQTASVTITEPTALSYTISQTNVTCYGASNGTANINVTGGTTPYSYLWNTTPTQNSANPTGIAGGIYSVVVTDGNGCTASSTINIAEPTQLIVNTTVVNNVTCFGASNGSAICNVSGGTGPYTYLWSGCGCTTQNATGLAPGSYIVTVTDANNCTALSSVTITQPTLLTLNASGTNVTCNGAANGHGLAISNGGTAPYFYQWLPSGGTNANTNGLTPGTYTVVVTDNNGCTQSDSISITQPAPVMLTTTGSTTICSGQNTIISAAATGGNGGYTYSWTGNGSLTGPTHTVSPTAPTTYVVTVTDASGCTGNSATVTINVTSLTAANLTVSPGVRMCEGNTATIFSNVTGNTGPVTINWNNNLGSGNGPYTVAPTTTTTYVVTVTDACNTTVTGSVTVMVSPLPTVNIFPLSGIACEEVPLNFHDNNPANTNAQYLWNFGDGASSTLSNPTHTYVNSGIYNINVIVTSADGCIDSAGTTATITVYPASVAKFETEAMDGTTISPLYRFTNTSSNAISCIWNFGDGTTSTIQTNIIHDYKKAGEYIASLTTTSADGCPGYSEMRVIIKPEFVIYIPNAFTPDGDGTNDIFIPKGMEISNFRMEIYSRWGEMIYYTNDLDAGWDGKANSGSDVAQMDVYVYKITAWDMNSKPHVFTGHVTLIKNEVEE